MSESPLEIPEQASGEAVWQMFDRIAPRYDLLNRMLSFGLDVRWRKRMAELLPRPDGLALLDLATGTADQLLMLADTPGRIASGVGMDMAEGMLAVGRKKIEAQGRGQSLVLKTGDATQIPADDASFDAVTISFGIRNVVDVPQALREMRRGLRPGGRALILEFSLPANPLVRFGHLTYLRYFLPTIGGIISGDLKAYRYLNRTIEAFPYGDAFCRLMEDAGFSSVRANPLTFGVASIYQGDQEDGAAD